VKIYCIFIISVSFFFLALAVVLHADRLYPVTLVWGLVNALLFPLYLSYFQPLTSFLLYMIVFLAGGRVIYTVSRRRRQEVNTSRVSRENKQAPEGTEQEKGGDVSKEITDTSPVESAMAGDGRACPSGRIMETPGKTIVTCTSSEPEIPADIEERAGKEGVPCLPIPRPLPCLPLITMEDRRKELAVLLERGITVDELVNIYLRCRMENNLLVSVEYLQAAFSRTDDSGIKLLLCADLVIIYRELGRYSEAATFVSSFLNEEGQLLETSTREHFEMLLVYLQELDKLLQKDGLTGTSYSDLPEMTKLKAGKIWKNNTIYL
jgi:hypothetical protein